MKYEGGKQMSDLDMTPFQLLQSKYLSLQSRLAVAEKERDELQKEKERMDWIEETISHLYCPDLGDDIWHSTWQESLRTAIDTAMSQKEPTE